MAMIAHVILAHQHPQQVVRLVEAIAHPTVDIFIHIDKNSPIAPFLSALRNHTDLKFISNRKKITWGAFSMVEATLQSFKEVLATNKPFGFINLISASDYPLKPAGMIHETLQRHVGRSFMEMHFSDSPWWIEAQSKVQKYHLAYFNFVGKHKLERLINQVTPIRKIPMKMIFTGRSQWMTLCADHVRYVLSYIDENPQVVRFFKYTWGPDEFFFQTILFNSPFRSDIVNDNLRYTDWTEGGASPKVLTGQDFEKLVNSGKLYARKFDVDSDVLDLIDERLLQDKS